VEKETRRCRERGVLQEKEELWRTRSTAGLLPFHCRMQNPLASSTDLPRGSKASSAPGPPGSLRFPAASSAKENCLRFLWRARAERFRH
jgi:hypothetical protein